MLPERADPMAALPATPKHPWQKKERRKQAAGPSHVERIRLRGCRSAYGSTGAAQCSAHQLREVSSAFMGYILRRVAGLGARACVVTAAAAAMLLLAECGASASARQRVEITGLNFSIVLPSGWAGAAIPQHPTSSDIKRLESGHPNIAAILQSPLARLFHFRFVANPPIVKGQFTPNLNVVVQSIPKGESLRGFFFSGASAAAQYVGTTRSARIGSLQALHYWSTKVQKFGTTPLLTDIVMVERAGLAYEFTFTSLARDQSSLQPVFDASEASISTG